MKVLKSFTECFKPLGTNHVVTILTNFCPNKRKILQVNTEAGFAAKRTTEQSENQFPRRAPARKQGPQSMTPCVFAKTETSIPLESVAASDPAAPALPKQKPAVYWRSRNITVLSPWLLLKSH